MENRQGQELRAQVNTSVFYRVVNVVFAALFFGVVLLSVFNNQSTAFAHSTPLLLLSAVLGVGVVFGASRLFSRLPTPGKIAEIISVCVGMVLFAALCFVVSFSLSGTPDPASDFGMVYSRAAAYATNGSLPDNYFLYYPTQQGFYVLLCGIFSFLKLLGVTNFLVPLVVINTVAVCGAVLLMYFCARRLFGVKKALFILVGAFFTVPFLLSGAVAYTYTITLPVPVAVMLLWMKTRGYWRNGESKKAILYFMLLSGIAAVGALLKLTVLVIYLAVLLDLLILLVGRGKLKMMGAGVGVCVAVFLLGTLLIKISPALPNYNTEADAIPLTSWIMMGLSENGADNQADLDLILHRPNKDARDAFVSQEIADRFGDYMPFGIFTHFGNKLAYTFGDPTLGLAQQLGTGTTGLRGLFLPGGSGFAGLCYAAFGLQMAVLVWAAVAAAKSLYRKNDALTFARLAMLGLLVFLLLWKTEPGEIVTFVPVFLLCGLEASPAPMLALQKKRAREALQTNVAPQDTTMELESASLDFLGGELESDDNQGWPQEPSAALAPQEPEPVVEPEPAPAPEPGQEPAFEPEQEPASGQLEESIWQQDIQEPEIQDTPLFELETEPAPELAPEEQNWADQAIQEAFAQGYDVEYTTEDGQVFYQQPDGRTYYIAEDGQAYYYPQEGEEGYYAEDGQFYYYPGYEPYAQQVFVDTPDGQQVYYQDYYDMPDEPYWDEETQQWYVPQPAGELTGAEGYEYGPQWQQPYQEPETAQLEWSEEDTAREDVAEPAYQPETPGEPVAPELDAFEPEAMEPQLEEPVFQPVPQDDALTEAEMAEDVQLWGMADEQPPAPEAEPEPEAAAEWEAEPEPELVPELTLWPELGLDEQPELEENQPAEEWQPDEPAAYTEEPEEPEELYAQPVLAVGETAPVDEYEAVAFEPEPEHALAAITFISEEPEEEEYSFELLPATEHAELAEEFDATEESVGFELFAEAETAEDEDGVFALPVLDIPEELDQADEPVTVAEDAAELQLFPEAELPEETPFEAEPLDEEVIPEPVEDDVAAKEERKLPLWLEVELEEALQKRRETLTEVDVDKLLQEPGEPVAEEPQQEPALEEPEEEVMLEASPVLDVPDEAEEDVESVPDVLQMLDAELERVIAPEEIEEEPPVNEAEPEPEDEPEALQAEETAPIQEEPEPQRPKITDEAVDDIIALLYIKRRAAEKRREMEAMAEVVEPVEPTAAEEESIALEPAQPEEEPAVAEWAAPVATVHEDAPVSLFDTEPDVSPEPEPEAELEAKVETMPETTPEAEEREEPEPAQEEPPSPELAAQREELLMRALEFATGGQPIAPPAPKTPAASVQAQPEIPAAAIVAPQPVMQQPEAVEPVAPPVVVQPQAQPATSPVPVIRQVQPTAAPQPAAMAPGTPPKRRPVVIQRVAPAPQYPAPPVDEVEAILQSLRRSAPPAHIAAVSAVQPKAVGRPVVPPAPVHTQPVNTVESVLKSLEQTAARPAAAPRPAQPAPVQPRENADWNTLHNAINNGLPQDRRYEVKKPSAYDELMKIVDHAKPEDKPRNRL